MSPLRVSSGGGCCGIACKGCRLSGATGGGGFRPLYCGRFLGSLATRNHTLVIVAKRVKVGGHSVDTPSPEGRARVLEKTI